MTVNLMLIVYIFFNFLIVNSLGTGSAQPQQQQPAVDYSMYFGSLNVQQTIQQQQQQPVNPYLASMGANAYTASYGYQQPQQAKQVQPDFDY